MKGSHTGASTMLCKSVHLWRVGWNNTMLRSDASGSLWCQFAPWAESEARCLGVMTHTSGFHQQFKAGKSGEDVHAAGRPVESVPRRFPRAGDTPHHPERHRPLRPGRELQAEPDVSALLRYPSANSSHMLLFALCARLCSDRLRFGHVEISVARERSPGAFDYVCRMRNASG